MNSYSSVESVVQPENLFTRVLGTADSREEYEFNLFGDVYKQKEIISLFDELLEARRKTLNESEDPPGDKLDPSKSSSNCCNSTIFTHPMICTDGIITGNRK